MTDTPVTIVTGTSRGIGRALAEHYVARGHRVVGCSRGAADWSLEGYEHHEVDVTDERAILRLMSHVRRTHRRLDVLVNNAAFASMNLALLTPASTVRKMLETNVLGPVLLCREAAKLMLPRRFGRIVNLSSVAVPLSLEREAVYVATKAALESFTATLARELGRTGITVNAIGVNPVQTAMTRGIPAKNVEYVFERLAIPRWGTPADVANVVDFFVRDESALVTGQTLYLGGVR